MLSTFGENSREKSHRLVGWLKFRHLQILVTLKECRSLNAAAKQLNVTQPALSKTLAEMEQTFGVALFERDSRGVVPTQYGQTVLRGAKLLLDDLERLRRETLSDHPDLLIKIGAAPFIAQGYLPVVFRELTRSNPQLRVRLKEAPVPELLFRLEQGELDAVITTFALPSSAMRSFQFRKLFTMNLVVIASASDPLTNLDAVPWDLLKDKRWILPPSDSIIGKAVAEMFVLDGLPPPVPVIESQQPLTNLQMVADDVGLSVLPSLALLNQPAEEQVKILNMSPRLPSWPVALIHRRGDPAPWLPLLLDALNEEE